MTINSTDKYVKICMSAWLLCEACMHSEKEKLSPEIELLTAWKECADSCLTIVSTIISNPPNLPQQAFNCFLYCRECQHACSQYTDQDIHYCGSVCDQCAEMMKEILLFHPN